MVNTRKSSLRPLGKAAAAAAGAGSHFISSRTRSSKRGTKADAAGLEETAAARYLLILEKAMTSVFEK